MKKLSNKFKSSSNNKFLDFNSILDFDSFKNIILNNKSYFFKSKLNNNLIVLPDKYRDLFLFKIKNNIKLLKIDNEYREEFNLVLGKKKINDVLLLWIYYYNFFIPIINQEKKKNLSSNSKNTEEMTFLNSVENRYFQYNIDFLENKKKQDIRKKDYVFFNRMGNFDFLLFKQAVSLTDYSTDYLLGSHKILLDITTDNIVVESLEKYSRNEIRTKPTTNSNINSNVYGKKSLRKIIKRFINFSEKKVLDDYFLCKINKISFRREKIVCYYFSKQNNLIFNGKHFDYINNLIFILGKKIKVLFLIRQLYFSKNFFVNYKYLIILRKKLFFLIKEEKFFRKKILFLKKKKNRIKIRNVNDKEDSFYYRRRSNFINFYNIMNSKKKGKYSKIFFSSITDFSVFVDVDGSKFLNSYLKNAFKSTIDEEFDLNSFFRESSYNLNYIEINESMENEVLSYYITKNSNVKKFLKGLNKYQYTTYNYAMPFKMDGDILEFEALYSKLLKENRRIKKVGKNFNEYCEYLLKNINDTQSTYFSSTSMVFDINEYVINSLQKSKLNFLTLSNKDFSIDQKTSMFFEFFIFGHIMFKILGLNQKFNFHFCFNFLSKDYLNTNEFSSTLKNNTLVSKFSRIRNTYKTQFYLLFKTKIWLYNPKLKIFNFSFIVSILRFIFSGIVFSFFTKKNIVFYIICKVYLYFIDTNIGQILTIIPPTYIKDQVIVPLIKKVTKILNLNYIYSDFVRFSYKIQCYIKIPGYSMIDINNFISYYIASPYVYFYEKIVYNMIKYFFILFDFILNLIF